MTDLRTLLHEAAPTPARPIDMAAVRARASRRPSRRIMAWIAGIGLVVGGIPVGSAVLSTANDDGQNVSVIDPDPMPAPTPAPGATTAPTTTSPGDAAQASSEPQRPASVGGGAEPDDREPAATGRRQVTEETAPHSSVPGFEDHGDFPLARECSVDNRGLAKDAERRCRFTATADGGFSFENNEGARGPGVGPTGEVIVTRDGQSTSYKAGSRSIQAEKAAVFLGCDIGIIEPGDRVEVILTNTDPETSAQSPVVLSAGEGWGC